VEYVAGLTDSGNFGDPPNAAAVTACAYLYSGDYSSSKKRQLCQTVALVREWQPRFPLFPSHSLNQLPKNMSEL
jgi:hypothetical protein